MVSGAVNPGYAFEQGKSGTARTFWRAGAERNNLHVNHGRLSTSIPQRGAGSQCWRLSWRMLAQWAVTK